MLNSRPSKKEENKTSHLNLNRLWEHNSLNGTICMTCMLGTLLTIVPALEDSVTTKLLNLHRGTIAAFFATIFMVFSTLVAPSSSTAKGWSSTGGGSGALCFDTPNTAALVSESRMKTGVLSDLQIASAISIESLDIHEASTLEKEGIAALAGRQLLESKTGLAEESVLYAAAMKRLQKIIPDASIRIEEIFQAIVAQKWEPKISLDQIFDRSDRAQLSENCIFVQILARHSTPGKQVIPRSRADLPLGIIEVDLRFWNKLDVLNKAALLFHESLYILAASHAGHVDSLRVRSLTRTIFSIDLESLAQNRSALEQLRSELRLMVGLN